LLGALLLALLSWRTFNNVCRAASTESVLCTLHILQINISEESMVSSVSTPMAKFFGNS